VDWDNPTLAPKERDLSLVGGSAVWNGAWKTDLFYQSYGTAKIDRLALAYYRCERIIQAIAAFCEQLLWTDAGGGDRGQSLQHLTGQFLPNHEVDLANQTDAYFPANFLVHNSRRGPFEANEAEGAEGRVFTLLIPAYSASVREMIRCAIGS
jgi:hypothetical protein